MKYLIIEANQTVGEWDSTFNVLLKIKNHENEDEKVNKVLAEWYANGEEDDGEFIFGDGACKITLNNIEQLTKKEYDIMRKFIYEHIA